MSGSHFSGGLSEEFKKASFSLLLGRFTTQTAGSLHGIFFFLHAVLKYGFLHVLNWIHAFNLDTHAFSLGKALTGW